MKKSQKYHNIYKTKKAMQIQHTKKQMKNSQIAQIFFEMADILEIQGVEWKPRAYKEAARTLESMEEDIGRIYEDGGIKALIQVHGIGESLAKKIEEFIKTGKIEAYEKLKKSVPSHINLLIKIPTIGPKKVKKLNEELKISNIKELEKAAKNNKIASLEGFGEKSQQDILEGINLMKSAKGRIPYSIAKKICDKIIEKLKTLKEIKEISPAGSLRRKKSTIGDIDILISSTKPEIILNTFTKLKDIQKILGKGTTKATIILKSGIQADLRVLPPKSWGAGLLYFTGNKNYNIRLRKLAIKQGYKLNEYGLFDKNTGKMIAGKTENEIYKKLGLKYIEPEKREE